MSVNRYRICIYITSYKYAMNPSRLSPHLLHRRATARHDAAAPSSKTRRTGEAAQAEGGPDEIPGPGARLSLWHGVHPRRHYGGGRAANSQALRLHFGLARRLSEGGIADRRAGQYRLGAGRFLRAD